MNRQITIGLCLVLVAAMTGFGCASNKNNEMSSLQQRNRSLTDQLNRTQAGLQSAVNERNALNERLAAIMAEADSLRFQLANLPAPEPAPAGWTSVPGGGMIAIEDGVLFAPGRSVLRDEAQRTLDAVVSTLQGSYSDKDIIVFGHTDDRPIKKSGWEDNWQLSTERALAVTRFLQQRGVSAGRLVASGCGEHRPRRPNSTEPNRTANRRVEIFAIDPQAWSGRSQ